MNEKDIETLLEWAETEKQYDFRDFVTFIKTKFEQKQKVMIEYNNLKETGVIVYYSVYYNVRFPDFNFSLCINDIKKGTVLKYITMDSFKKKSECQYHIIDKDGKVFKISCE